jgi:16S rRNA (guanine527-N7)-methyltransferase
LGFTSLAATQLEPYLGGQPLTPQQLDQISQYLELLLRWNARMNLTSLREAEQILSRHFGESFFLARLLSTSSPLASAIDVGSGAGFPGIPLKIFAPHAHILLIESQNKKATFLREVIRTLRLTNINVIAERAENVQQTAELVTLRAVEKFDRALPAAAALVRKPGRIGLLIGSGQVSTAQQLLPDAKWEAATPLPGSRERVAIVGGIG